MQEFITLMFIKKSCLSNFGTGYYFLQNVTGFRIYDLRAYFLVWFNVSTESEGREQGRGSVQDMVATLQARREELEAKLHDRNRELKLLCIQEAELTGVLPPETPLEPGELPPVFRRRVGTAFTYPENLINNNKLKSKEVYLFNILEDWCSSSEKVY